ncbi:TonB-dependent receptor domain-containing protein [Sphingomonas quercus]|uniref:TonB-dependent receptor n=1 Tax=Sphingomonas quercus TaxID=2842451 RepID=A0ABS6BMI2_9SPHN|nr:TonB-dependent receptor [Sphingomonas quercus]MBU3079505.1 TonB-dependent receptor [Sphingomonas quercus]
MHATSGNPIIRRFRGPSAVALAAALLHVGAAHAQPAAAPDQTDTLAQDEQTITVTGSRIERAGFDAPTPTTVIGAVDLRQGNRPNLQQVLNDSPAFRPTTTPQVSVGNTSSGSAPIDLRGLGGGRTLTLLNGRRFVGNDNLNYIPMGLVDRVETVTGGASAAYGSDAVAGVVNIIFKTKVTGITVGATTGISSRGDGGRYGGDITLGTGFAEDRGQIMASAEYMKDRSIPDRNSRRNLGSAGIVRLNPTVATDPRQVLVRDVNYGNVTSTGLITSGALAGQMFNEDGTLRTYRAGQSLAANPVTTPFPAQSIGGADAVGLYDRVVVSTPVERISAFARASYEFGAGITGWVDGSFGQSRSQYDFLPDIAGPASLTIQATNPFLSPAIRARLAAAGQTSFTLGKFYDGPFMLGLDARRRNLEGAIGIDADLGGSWTVRAHYSHGEVKNRTRNPNTPIAAKLTNALNAVAGANGPVCAINADASAANDDAACRPINPFGTWNASADALGYVMGTQRSDSTNKLDAAAAEVQGDLFKLWGSQPITIAFGAEARWESQHATAGALDLAGAFGGVNLYGNPVSGKFNVKEGFAEVAVPFFEIEDKVKIDLNGAARYSDYSRSGGVWTWKGGATVDLFDQLLLRGTRSRDIRAPSIGNLFSVSSLNVRPLVDQDTAGRAAANPAYNPTPQAVTTFSGGNPDLVPEISHTTTLGATFSPRFLPGFNASVDWYDIKIDGAIATLSGTQLTLACANGNAAACGSITRDATGTVSVVRANAQNVARFETSGLDIELSQRVPLSDLSNALSGTLNIRALATYVKKFVYDTGITRVDSAGDVGSATTNAIPSWRGNLIVNYQGSALGIDARVRYVGKGKYDHLLDAVLVNNKIKAFTYLDLGASYKVTERLRLTANVNNVFDKQPPISPTGPLFYDAIGTYFSVGARVTF